MKHQIQLMATFILAVIILFASGQSASAVSFQLSGRVTDQSNNPIAGATVAVIDPATNGIVASTSTDSGGNYAVSVLSGTYNVRVTPPSGSSFRESTITNVSITSDTILNVVLAPVAGQVSFRGILRDQTGRALANQRIDLYGPFNYQTFTSADGSFLFSSVAAAFYTLQVCCSNGNPLVPNEYVVQVSDVDLTTSRVQDLTLPTVVLQVTVVDSAGNPVPNTEVRTGLTYDPFDLFPGGRTLPGWNLNVRATTNSSGMAQVVLLPTSSPFNVIATPPVDSGFNPTTINILKATQDSSLAIIYQLVQPINAPVDPVQVNTPINFSANFADPGQTATHTATWDWGDGTTSAGLVTEPRSPGSVTGSHTYTAPGVYSVKLTVKRGDITIGQSVFQYIVIYDPTAGYVTGGGWINSPTGAYAASPSLTGKATFGFISKYQKGATVPTGNTQFQFHVAKLDFRSTSYQWLVVAGAKAQFKGSGMINGSGDYSFILTAIDGQVSGGGGVDKFRIKIWDKNNGDSIVYDNQIGTSDTADPSTAIASGSIQIQK